MSRQGLSSPWRQLLLIGGAFGAVLFTVVYLVEGATRPGYNAWRQPASDLSVGPGGGVQVVSFIICGLLFLGFAVGLNRASRWAAILVAIAGVGLLIAGVFVTDPAPGYPPGSFGPESTVHGTIHLVASFLVFTALPVACFVLALWFARATKRGWAIYSVASGFLMWTALAAFGAANGHGGPAGVFERLAIGTGWLWIAVVALRLLMDERREADQGPHIQMDARRRRLR
jgi:hypothetical membrane protein